MSVTPDLDVCVDFVAVTACVPDLPKASRLALVDKLSQIHEKNAEFSMSLVQELATDRSEEVLRKLAQSVNSKETDTELLFPISEAVVSREGQSTKALNDIIRVIPSLLKHDEARAQMLISDIVDRRPCRTHRLIDSLPEISEKSPETALSILNDPHLKKSDVKVLSALCAALPQSVKNMRDHQNKFCEIIMQTYEETAMHQMPLTKKRENFRKITNAIGEMAKHFDSRHSLEFTEGIVASEKHGYTSQEARQVIKQMPDVLSVSSTDDVLSLVEKMASSARESDWAHYLEIIILLAQNAEQDQHQRIYDVIDKYVSNADPEACEALMERLHEINAPESLENEWNEILHDVISSFEGGLRPNTYSREKAQETLDTALHKLEVV